MTPYSLQAMGNLGALNVGARAAVLGLLPLLAQLDAMVGASLGLGALKADLQAQYNATLDATISITDPTAYLTTALKALLQAVAELQAAIAAGVSLPQVKVGVAAKLQLLATLKIKLGAINALLEAALRIRLEAVQLLAQAQAALNGGSGAIYAASGQTLTETLAQISSYDHSDAGFFGSDEVTVIVLIGKTPGFQTGAQFLFPLNLS